MVPRAGRGTEGAERCGQPGLEGFLPAPAVTPQGERGWGAGGGGEGAPDAPGGAGGRPCCCGCCCRGGRSARAPGTGACGAPARSASGLPAGPGRAARSCGGCRVGGSAPLRRGMARGGRGLTERPPPQGAGSPRGPAAPARPPPWAPWHCPPGTHVPSVQCAALSTHCSAMRKPPQTCCPSSCSEAMYGRRWGLAS